MCATTTGHSADIWVNAVKSTAPIQGTAYETRVTLINESGLYALILSSKLPQAKDITRVFFTTTEAELIYLDDEIFEIVAASQCCSSQDSLRSYERQAETQEASPQTSAIKHQPSFDPEARYNGMLFEDIIAKYWELFNDGKEPVEGDRNALTFELAVTLRSICGFSLEKMMQVVPNYWAKKCTEGSVPLCTGRLERAASALALSAQAPRTAQGHRVGEAGHQLLQNRPEGAGRGLQHRIPEEYAAERE